MNERIRQLAEQVVGPSRLHGGDFALMGNKQVEKFAELIIDECLRMCDCADVSFLEHHYSREADGAASVKQFIKDWFGVEE